MPPPKGDKRLQARTAAKLADAIDRHIAGRVRIRRKEVGMSQQELGRRLGVTFQQIQKYENGANRISAGRLYATAHHLGVNVAYFFEDAPPIED